MEERFEDVTIGISTFMRPSKLDNALEAIEALDTVPEEVIIADDSIKKSRNRKICSSYTEKMDARYISMEPDEGVSASRNRIVEEASTEFLMLLDDDQYLRKEVIPFLREILESDGSLAGVAPSWIENGNKITDARNLSREGEWIVADVAGEPSVREVEGKTYFLYDFIATSALYRTEALRDIGWDENYTIGGEHLDFFLAYKMKTSWSFAATEEVVLEHDPGRGKFFRYMSHRRNPEKLSRSRNYFREKWGVRGFLFREKHCESYERRLSQVLTQVFYSLPNVFHWHLKKSSTFEVLKKRYSNLTGEEFR
ncbi:MAG: glycosyltransferase family 2 protein [Candidatus Nanosalina sp.]